MVTKDESELGIALAVGVSALLRNGGQKILDELRKKGVTEERITAIQKKADEYLKQIFEDIE